SPMWSKSPGLPTSFFSVNRFNSRPSFRSDFPDLGIERIAAGGARLGMQVGTRCRDIVVAKRGGYHGQWRAPLQTVRGMSVAKPVRRHLGGYVELGRDLFDNVVHGTSAQALRTIASAMR